MLPGFSTGTNVVKDSKDTKNTKTNQHKTANSLFMQAILCTAVPCYNLHHSYNGYNLHCWSFTALFLETSNCACPNTLKRDLKHILWTWLKAWVNLDGYGYRANHPLSSSTAEIPTWLLEISVFMPGSVAVSVHMESCTICCICIHRNRSLLQTTKSTYALKTSKWNRILSNIIKSSSSISYNNCLAFTKSVWGSNNDHFGAAIMKTVKCTTVFIKHPKYNFYCNSATFFPPLLLVQATIKEKLPTDLIQFSPRVFQFMVVYCILQWSAKHHTFCFNTSFPLSLSQYTNPMHPPPHPT